MADQDEEEPRSLRNFIADLVTTAVALITTHTDERFDALMADMTGFNAAMDRVTKALSDVDTREKAESGANQAVVDSAATAMNAAADHIGTLDSTPTPAPTPAPGPVTTPPTGPPIPGPGGTQPVTPAAPTAPPAAGPGTPVNPVNQPTSPAGTIPVAGPGTPGVPR